MGYRYMYWHAKQDHKLDGYKTYTQLMNKIPVPTLRRLIKKRVHAAARMVFTAIEDEWDGWIYGEVGPDCVIMEIRGAGVLLFMDHERPKVVAKFSAAFETIGLNTCFDPQAYGTTDANLYYNEYGQEDPGDPDPKHWVKAELTKGVASFAGTRLKGIKQAWRQKVGKVSYLILKGEDLKLAWAIDKQLPKNALVHGEYFEGHTHIALVTVAGTATRKAAKSLTEDDQRVSIHTAFDVDEYRFSSEWGGEAGDYREWTALFSLRGVPEQFKSILYISDEDDRIIEVFERG